MNHKAGVLTKKSLRETAGKIALKFKIGDMDVVTTEVDPRLIK